MLRKISDLLAVFRKKRDASTHGDFREVIFVVVQSMTNAGRDRFIDYELPGPSLKDIPTVDATRPMPSIENFRVWMKLSYKAL